MLVGIPAWGNPYVKTALFFWNQVWDSLEEVHGGGVVGARECARQGGEPVFCRGRSDSH